MNKKARLNISLDQELKMQTAEILNDIGLDFTTAINLYFKQIVNKHKIPFELTSNRYYSVAEVAGENWHDGLDDLEDEWE